MTLARGMTSCDHSSLSLPDWLVPPVDWNAGASCRPRLGQQIFCWWTETCRQLEEGTLGLEDDVDPHAPTNCEWASGPPSDLCGSLLSPVSKTLFGNQRGIKDVEDRHEWYICFCQILNTSLKFNLASLVVTWDTFYTKTSRYEDRWSKLESELHLHLPQGTGAWLMSQNRHVQMEFMISLPSSSRALRGICPAKVFMNVPRHTKNYTNDPFHRYSRNAFLSFQSMP